MHGAEMYELPDGNLLCGHCDVGKTNRIYIPNTPHETVLGSDDPRAGYTQRLCYVWGWGVYREH